MWFKTTYLQEPLLAEGVPSLPLGMWLGHTDRSESSLRDTFNRNGEKIDEPWRECSRTKGFIDVAQCDLWCASSYFE